MSAPRGWEVVRLGDVLTLINGRAYRKHEEEDNGTPVLRIQNLNGRDKWFYSNLRLPEDKYCQQGDLLFAWSATFGPYLYDGPRAIFHYHIWKIRLGERLHKKFAYYLLLGLTDKIKAAGRGISMLHMTKSGMEAWEVALPSLEEQKRIAAILDKADALRRLRRQALDRLNSLGQAIFHDMFGDAAKARHNWENVPFGELVTNRDGERIPLKKEDRANRQGQYDYYGASGVIDRIDGWLFEGPHLLIGEDGANLLARNSPLAFIGEGKFWVNNHAHILAYNGRAELRFLEYFIESIDLSKFVTGSAQPKLNQKQLNRIPVPLPSLREQNFFIKALEMNSCGVDQALVLLNKSEQLFASLQQRAFRGDL